MRTKKICNGTLEDYHAICWARLRLLNESDQVLSKCGTNQIKRRIVERNGQYARVDLRAKSFELPHDTPPLLLSLLFLGLVSPRPAPLLCFPFDILCEQRGVFTVVCNNNLLFADLEIVERDATGLDLVRSSGLGGN